MDFNGFNFKQASNQDIDKMLDSIENVEKRIKFLEYALKIKEKLIAKEQEKLDKGGYSLQGLMQAEINIEMFENEKEHISDKLDSLKFFYTNENNRDKEEEFENLSEGQLQEFVCDEWDKLTEKGYSENKTAKKIKEKIGGLKSTTTIKRWNKPEYNEY